MHLMNFALIAVAAISLYLLATGLFLSLRPEWTANQWWYPLNRKRLERLGYQPHTMTTAVLRANGIFLVGGISLIALSLIPGEIAILARRGYLGLFALAFAFVIVRLLAWILLPSSVLQANTWLTGGMAGTKHRSPFLRVRPDGHHPAGSVRSGAGMGDLVWLVKVNSRPPLAANLLQIQLIKQPDIRILFEPVSQLLVVLFPGRRTLYRFRRTRPPQQHFVE